MIFSSALFFFFFAAVFTMHWAILPALVPPRHLRKARHAALLIASYVFFASYEWIYAFLLLFFTLTAYGSAFFLQPGGSRDKLRGWLLLAVIVTFVGLLGYYKYYNFFLGNLLTLVGIVGYHPDVVFHTIALPLGISFFTFQALSYVIDVWRGKTPVEQSFLRFALFKSFFPQLVAGPIVTAREFLPQLYADKELDLERLRSGARWFALGFIKKAVIADNVSPAVDMLFANPAGQFLHNSSGAWLAALGFSAQLYADFSGYSDMAWGSAIWLGFDLPENFRMPYMARSITDHWRRWHMSLARWIREYVYISMGGNRVSFVRHKVNLLFSFVISGLWHGANWTYVVWGTAQGIILVIENTLGEWKKKREEGQPFTEPGAFARIISVPVQLTLWLYMFIFTTSSHVVFRSPSLSAAWTHLKTMYSFSSQGLAPQPSIYRPILISTVVVLLGQLFGYWYFEKKKFQVKVPIWLEFAFYPFMVLVLIQLAAPEGGAFIYFVF